MFKYGLLFSIFFSFLALSQEELKFSDHKLSAGVTSYSIINFGPILTYSTGKQQLSLGILFSRRIGWEVYALGQIDESTSSGGFSFSRSLLTSSNIIFKGITINYRRFPFEPRRSFNLYYEGNFIYRRYPVTINDEYHGDSNTLSSCLNFGFKADISKRISFLMSLGAAYHVVLMRNRYLITPSGNEIDLAEHPFPYRISPSFFLGIQVGLFE